MRRRIGRGEQTSIWGDAWLLSEGSGKVITRRPVDSIFPNTVNELIEESTGEWSLSRLHQFLWPCDVSRVLQVPLGPLGSTDRTYWFHSKNGMFTVRSCYFQILSDTSMMASSTSGHSLTLSSKEWQWLWGLQLPPKIRTFLCRACHDILPVRVALVKRHLGGDPFCPLCHMALESTAHPFFECPIFARVWTVEPFNISMPGMHTKKKKWFRFLRSQLDIEAFTLACVVCWRVWWTRNRLVHEGDDGGNEDIIEGAEHFLEAYRSAQFPRNSHGVSISAIWSAPPEEIIKINFDVGFFEPDRYQVAMVARDAAGTCVWWRVRRYTGQPSSVVGEAIAALEGVRVACEKGWMAITLEGDNAQVVHAIQKRDDCSLLPFGDFISSLFSLSSFFAIFSCNLVRRTGNMLAHSLAHFPLADLNIMEACDLPADLATII